MDGESRSTDVAHLLPPVSTGCEAAAGEPALRHRVEANSAGGFPQIVDELRTGCQSRKRRRCIAIPRNSSGGRAGGPQASEDQRIELSRALRSTVSRSTPAAAREVGQAKRAKPRRHGCRSRLPARWPGALEAIIALPATGTGRPQSPQMSDHPGSRQTSGGSCASMVTRSARCSCVPQQLSPRRRTVHREAQRGVDAPGEEGHCREAAWRIGVSVWWRP